MRSNNIRNKAGSVCRSSSKTVEILALYKSNHGLKSISRQLKISQAAVKRILNLNGVYEPPASCWNAANISAQQKARVRELHKAFTDVAKNASARSHQKQSPQDLELAMVRVVNRNSPLRRRPKTDSEKEKLAQRQRESWARGDRDHQRVKKMRVVACLKCGCEFQQTKTRRVFCTPVCQGRYCGSKAAGKTKKHPLPNGTCRAEVERWRYKNDPAFRLRFILKRKMQRFISGQKTSGAMERLLGCSLDQLRAHIESQFRHGMDWGNQGIGIGRWQIDHILPQSIFSPTFEQQMICWNWQNLRPIWGTENAKKGSRIIPGKSQLPLPICHS